MHSSLLELNETDEEDDEEEQPGMQPGMHQPGMQQPGMQQPGMQQPGMQQPGMNHLGLPVQMKVEWLTAVLQKYRCVPVDARYAKTGASSLFIGMGWDTESGLADLDLDLSLIPID